MAPGTSSSSSGLECPVQVTTLHGLEGVGQTLNQRPDEQGIETDGQDNVATRRMAKLLEHAHREGVFEKWFTQR